MVHASDVKNAPIDIADLHEPEKVITIRRINIFDSPILSAWKGEKQVHLVLDTGATASLISLEKATELNLKILPTTHRAIQVDGISDLKVIGEVHTEFQRGQLNLQFSGLVVNKLGTDILAGTNFHKENDVYCRMAHNMIIVKGSNTFPSTPVEVLKMERTSKIKLVKVNRTRTVIPGDSITLKLPPECPSEGTYIIEPKSEQGRIICNSQIVTAKDSEIHVEVNSNDKATPMKIKKNSFPIQVREAIEVDDEVKQDKKLITQRFKFSSKNKTFEDKMKEAIIDQAGTLTPSERKRFINTCREYQEVFGDDLPGYNDHYGVVKASIQFASKARPTTHRSRMPNYGKVGQKLYNEKILKMFHKGVLVDPFQLGIQPRIINDSWIIRKQSAARKPWEECTEKDVRLVTGFDPVNKFLSQIPSKASDPMDVYTSLSNWKVLAELDFRDFYWQLRFNLETAADRRQLEYLCIRTAGGTLAYARGPNGLLGMDAVCDELTDKILGDMVLQGKVAKLADNIYFGAETIEGLHNIFREILRRCWISNLRIKPSKIKINIANADILGLHWNKGTLTPSKHKLDPLAVCERPSTVKGLRSFLGAVRFNEVCLNSRRLANATEKLDTMTPATKEGKEKIKWTEDLIEAFNQVQDICRDPQTVYVPKKGDLLYIVGDAAPSRGPGIGSKLLIQREGSDTVLPSFNHGMRVKNQMQSWSPCEVESYQLSQAVKKFKPFLRFVGTKTTALIDSRASVLAIQRLEKGQPSTSRRLQDLLVNISAENITVKHISAKLPSPILKYVDFASRHPIECDDDKCTICRESKNPDVTFFGSANAQDEECQFPHITTNMWKDIQSSCKDMRQAAALMQAGKVPHKKEKRSNDISRYLRSCTLNKNGLVVAKSSDKRQIFLPSNKERIAIPRDFSYTYSTVLHRKYQHPNKTQMIKMFNRHFVMLNAEETISKVTEA